MGNYKEVHNAHPTTMSESASLYSNHSHKVKTHDWFDGCNEIGA